MVRHRQELRAERNRIATPDELRRLIERYPVIGVTVIRHMSRRLEAAERELEAMAYQPVDQRLARRLLDLGQRFRVRTERGTLIEARLTRQELAEMVGTTRETLAHTLADLRRRGRTPPPPGPHPRRGAAQRARRRRRAGHSPREREPPWVP